jgi:hypothetical protein
MRPRATGSTAVSKLRPCPHDQHPRRPHPDPGLRLPVHAADRPARARGRGLLRAAPLGHGETPSATSRPGRDPVRRPAVGACRRDAARRPAGVRPRRAGARHLLRHADHGRAARRQRRAAAEREYGYAQVRARGHPAAARHRRPHQPGGLRPARRLDEPRRPGRRLPAGFSRHRRDRQRPLAGIADEDAVLRRAVPPEVTHTRQGRASSSASATRSAAAATCGRRRNIIDDAIAQVREQVGDDEVLLGLSGGVDSSVVAALLHRAIGDRSPASSSTTACCASARAIRSWPPSPATWACA